MGVELINIVCLTDAFVANDIVEINGWLYRVETVRIARAGLLHIPLWFWAE